MIVQSSHLHYIIKGPCGALLEYVYPHMKQTLCAPVHSVLCVSVCAVILEQCLC